MLTDEQIQQDHERLESVIGAVNSLTTLAAGDDNTALLKDVADRLAVIEQTEHRRRQEHESLRASLLRERETWREKTDELADRIREHDHPAHPHEHALVPSHEHPHEHGSVVHHDHPHDHSTVVAHEHPHEHSNVPGHEHPHEHSMVPQHDHPHEHQAYAGASHEHPPLEGEIARLWERVSPVDGMAGRIAEAQGGVSELRTETEDLRSRVRTHEHPLPKHVHDEVTTDIGELTTLYEALQRRLLALDGLTTDIAELGARLTRAEERIGTHEHPVRTPERPAPGT